MYEGGELVQDLVKKVNLGQIPWETDSENPHEGDLGQDGKKQWNDLKLEKKDARPGVWSVLERGKVLH